MQAYEVARLARERRGITRKELAVRSGISVDTIKEWELGKTDPRLSTVETLACTLGIGIDQYIGFGRN